MNARSERHSSRRRHRPGCRRSLFLFLFLGSLGILLAFSTCLRAADEYLPASLFPPEPEREFRAAWIATLKNIDWPSQPGLPVAQQKAELIALLDVAAKTHLNAVLLHVRTACDALYASNIEPWSEYLTGRMGQAPAPFYDPLAFAIEEAHRRGIELHAWFNPYRARHMSAFSPPARTHISKTRPQLVRTYANQLWLDPGEKEVQDYSLRVVLDVVARYDIDGVHFDDYFYPYPEKDARQQYLPFPDWSTYGRYKAAGGKLARDDWRRENVNVFLRRVSAGIRQLKPWVKFGVSPFGIWRPGNPPSIKGFDAYGQLYADSRQWLMDGVCDYLAPQLYWSTERTEQSFPVLLEWWTRQNPLGRHLWPGIAHGNGAVEVAHQIRQSRQQLTSDGQLHWSIKAIAQNRGGVADVLRRDLYAQKVLTPAYPWLGSQGRTPLNLSVTNLTDGSIRFSWRPSTTTNATRSTSAPSPAWQWVVQRDYRGRWTTDILGGGSTSFNLQGPNGPDGVVVRAVDRYGNLGLPAGLRRISRMPAAQ